MKEPDQWDSVRGLVAVISSCGMIIFMEILFLAMYYVPIGFPLIPSPDVDAGLRAMSLMPYTWWGLLIFVIGFFIVMFTERVE